MMCENLPTPRQAYVGITSKAWTTVFGSPCILNRLWSYHPNFQNIPKVVLSGASAVHAPHLAAPDFRTIVGESLLLETQVSSDAVLVSSTTCERFTASTLGELLLCIVAEISQDTLPMEGTVQALLSNINRENSHKTVQLTVLGPTLHITLVQRLLEKSSFRINITMIPPATKISESVREGSNLIAICWHGC